MPKASPSLASTLPKGYESSALRSPRDSDSPARHWKRTNDYRRQERANEEALEYLSRAVEKMRRRMLGGMPAPEAPEQMHPFKIYSVGANQFQVRGGYIGYRSNYLIPSANLASTRTYYNASNELVLFGCGTDDFGVSSDGTAYGNYIFPSTTNLFEQPVKNSGTPITIDANTDAETPFLVCSNQPGTSSPIGNSVILENGATGYYLWFWTVIYDNETDGAYTELWCGYSSQLSNLTQDNNSGIPPYDKGQQLLYEVIPLGCVDGATKAITQFQSDNLLNRYTIASHRDVNLVSFLSVSNRIPQRFRGYWNQGVADTLVFAGDVVIDDRYTATITGVGSVYMSYLKLPTAVGGGGYSIYDSSVTGGSPSSSFGTANTNWIKFGLHPQP